MTPCRLIVDPPQDGAWNMAVDEALLEDAANEGRASLRFYQWREPTLSLGYFQSHRDRHVHPASAAAKLVRRLSGGGALLHDRELTYSICLPAKHPLAPDSSELYGVVHRTFIGVLAKRGIPACLAGDDPSQDSEPEEPFLCFARRTSADVVLSSAGSEWKAPKIVGSAQRRRRGAVLQHGAVLLATSKLAPELPGISESDCRAPEVDSLIASWQTAIASALQLKLQAEHLNGELRKTAQRLQAEKYSDRSWTERR
jgi:lipoate-protein ligase A